MLKKKSLSLLLVMVLITVGVVFSAGIVGAKTLKVANYFGTDHPVNNNLNEIFKKNVEEKTNGEITVQIYPAGQLGSEEEFTEGVMMGNIEMAVTGNMWEMYNETISFMQLPYLFVSMDHAFDIMNSPIGTTIYKKHFEEIGIDVLGFFSQGERAISNTVRPIETPEDTKGIKMRTWQGTTIIGLMERLGFDVTVMSMSELFTALQQEVVDGQDNPVSATYHRGWFEVLDYVSLTKHMVAPNYIVINKDLMSNFSEEDQKIIREAAQETVAKIHSDIKMEEKEILEEIQTEMDIQVTRPDIKPFMEKVTPMIDDFVKDHPEVEDEVEIIQKTGEYYIE